ncbi:BTB/POZ domain-containing protein 2-like [Paramacrobiotus metropolitanus]|uniref:BTB/POZ domain-containing protein 2-like n=1 Tax=Paramacrobiotus metropolitanus TaxID=2943436 RepID=UPI002445F52D|nr:BTB/POZ domain-containing protein 2-like [Paramacrobiotus metropolitanus]
MSTTTARDTRSSVPPRGTIDGVDKRMDQLLRSGDLSDVHFLVGRNYELIKAHKLVLSSGSDLFHAMLNGPGRLHELPGHAIVVPDIPPLAFKNMLQYLYTNEKRLTVENVFPTLKCADQYQVQQLADHCVDFILTDLHRGPDNCFRYIEDAVSYGVKHENIVENCLHFVDIRCKDLLQSEHFAKLEYGPLTLILKRDTLFMDETLICAAVNRWAVAVCARRKMEPSSANRLQVLGKLLYLIRFPVMTNQEIADLPAEFRWLEAAATKEMQKNRFPKQQPRRAPVIRVGDVEFRHNEEVFVKRDDKWHPAVVIGTRGSAVVLMCNESIQKVVPENIVCAADILTANLLVLHPDPGFVDLYKDCKYVRLEGGYHITKFRNGREQKVKFSQIFIPHSRVEAWRKGKEKSGNGSTRKRSLDVAGLM